MLHVGYSGTLSAKRAFRRACNRIAPPGRLLARSQPDGWWRMVVRSDVARDLAVELRAHAGRTGVYAIAVAPGSLWLAAEVARQLRVPFDLFPVHALGGAEEQEPTVGLVGSGGMLVIDRAAVAARRLSLSALAEAAQSAARALVTFERELRDGAEPPDLRASTIILLDDGRTPIQILRMAITALRRCWVRGTIVALPTITASELELVRTDAEAIVSAVVSDGTVSDEVSRLPAPASVAEIQRLLRGGRAPGAGDVPPPAEVQRAPTPTERLPAPGLAASAAGA